MKDLFIYVGVVYFWSAVLIAVGWIIYKLMDGKALLDEIVQDIERTHKRGNVRGLKRNLNL